MDIEISGKRAFIHYGGHSPTPAPQAPAVLLLHGAQQDHSCWFMLGRGLLRRGFTVIAPDLPGHGNSAGPALATIDELADWTVALLDALDLAQVGMIGHSMGSLVALEMAIRHPSRVTRIALLGSAVPMPVNAQLLEAAQHEPDRAAAQINLWSYSNAAQLGGSPLPGFRLTGINRATMERQPPATLPVDLNACNRYRPDFPLGCQVAVPVLILTGSQDRMTPAKAGLALQRQLPGSQWLAIEGAGHALMAEKPAAVQNALLEFFA